MCGNWLLQTTWWMCAGTDFCKRLHRHFLWDEHALFQIMKVVKYPVARAGHYTITSVLPSLHWLSTVWYLFLTELHLDLTVVCLALTVIYSALTVEYQYADGGTGVAEPDQIPGRARRALNHHDHLEFLRSIDLNSKALTVLYVPKSLDSG